MPLAESLTLAIIAGLFSRFQILELILGIQKRVADRLRSACHVKSVQISNLHLRGHRAKT